MKYFPTLEYLFDNSFTVEITLQNLNLIELLNLLYNSFKVFTDWLKILLEIPISKATTADSRLSWECIKK